MKNYKKIVRAKERMSKMKKIISFVMVLAIVAATAVAPSVPGIGRANGYLAGKW